MSDLVTLAGDTAILDMAGDPATFVVLACERAKSWLTQAVEHGDIDQIVELKSQAEAIRIYTTQKQLGKDAELAAAEIVRRAERGIGVTIRRGQEEGKIARQGDIGGGGCAGAPAAATRTSRTDKLGRPRDWLPNGSERMAVYAVTDDVSDEHFEEAITEAKDEGNLSRANVVRKVHGEPMTGTVSERLRAVSSGSVRQQRAASRPEHLRRTRHIDPNRVVEQTILQSGISDSMAELLDYGDLDRDRLEVWISSLSDVIRSLTTMKNNLKKELIRG